MKGPLSIYMCIGFVLEPEDGCQLKTCRGQAASGASGEGSQKQVLSLNKQKSRKIQYKKTLKNPSLALDSNEDDKLS